MSRVKWNCRKAMRTFVRIIRTCLHVYRCRQSRRRSGSAQLLLLEFRSSLSLKNNSSALSLLQLLTPYSLTAEWEKPRKSSLYNVITWTAQVLGVLLIFLKVTLPDFFFVSRSHFNECKYKLRHCFSALSIFLRCLGIITACQLVFFRVTKKFGLFAGRLIRP